MLSVRPRGLLAPRGNRRELLAPRPSGTTSGCLCDDDDDDGDDEQSPLLNSLDRFRRDVDDEVPNHYNCRLSDPFGLKHLFEIKMKFTAGILCLLAGGSSAFSPNGFVSHKSGLMVPTSAQDESNSPLVARTPMDMVAGGAERAYGQEYYEGM